MLGFSIPLIVSFQIGIVGLTTNETANHRSVLIAPITSHGSTHDYVSFHAGLSEVSDTFVTYMSDRRQLRDRQHVVDTFMTHLASQISAYFTINHYVHNLKGFIY